MKRKTLSAIKALRCTILSILCWTEVEHVLKGNLPLSKSNWTAFNLSWTMFCLHSPQCLPASYFQTLLFSCVLAGFAPKTPEHVPTHIHTKETCTQSADDPLSQRGRVTVPMEMACPSVCTADTHRYKHACTPARLNQHQRSWANPQMSTTMERKRRRGEAFIYLYLGVVQIHSVHGELLGIF